MFGSFFKDYILKLNIQDCIVCCLDPIFKYNLIFGIFPIKCTCKHSRKPTEDCEFKTSIPSLIYAYFIATLIFLTIVWYIYLLVTEFKENGMLAMEILAETLYCAGGLSVVTNHIFKNYIRKYDLKGWAVIVANRKIYGIHTMINAKKTGEIRLLSFLYIFGMTIIVAGISSFTLTRSYDELYSWTTIRRPVSILVGFIQVSVVLQFSIEGVVVRSIMKTSHMFLKIYMKGYASYTSRYKLIDYMREHSRNVIFLQQLQRIQRLQSAVYQNLKFASDILRPSFILWFCLVLCSMILSIYVFITTWVIGLEDNRFILLLVLRTTTMCVIMVYLLWQIEKLAIIVSTYYCNLLSKSDLLSMRHS